MWKIKKYLCALSLVLCLSLHASVCTASSATYSISEEQLTQLELHLNELEENNEKLKSLLTLSEQDCEIALMALTASQSELKALRSELTQALIDSEKAKKSLQIANEELANASKSCKQLEKQKNRAENQRTFWQILAAIAAGVAVAR